MSDKPMSKTERQTLIRLVKQRFRLLGTGLNARRYQVEAGVREEILAEHEARCKELRKEYDERVLKPLRELRQAEVDWREQVRDEGFDYRNTSWMRRGVDEVLSAADAIQIVPADLDKKVKERMATLLGGVPMTQYALELEESRLIEELLVGDITSDGAQDFMAKIPDVDKLLPLANSAAALELEEVTD